MEKVFPNLTINNEPLRDLSWVFDFSRLTMDNDTIKIGLWQEKPNHPFTRLSLWTPDFQVLCEGDGVLEIVPSAQYAGKFDKGDTLFDLHWNRKFELSLRHLLGAEVAKKYRYYLKAEQQCQPKRVILTEVMNRKISTPEVFSCAEDAQKEMSSRIASIFDVKMEDVVELVNQAIQTDDEVDSDTDDFTVCKDGAFGTRYGADYDWKISHII